MSRRMGRIGLGGNSLLDCVAFGRRAGAHAAEYARSINPANISDQAPRGWRKQKIVDLFARSTNERAPAPAAGNGRDYAHLHRRVSRGGPVCLRRNAESTPFVNVIQMSLFMTKAECFNTDLLTVLRVGLHVSIVLKTIIASAPCTQGEPWWPIPAPTILNGTTRNWLKHVAVYNTPDGPAVTYLPVDDYKNGNRRRESIKM